VLQTYDQCPKEPECGGRVQVCGWEGVWGVGTDAVKLLSNITPWKKTLVPLLLSSLVYFACKFVAVIGAVASGRGK
jgi:hypothetical protein